MYAPKPEKVKPAKSMAARLKRLEGMVRGMLDGEGNTAVPREPAGQTAPLTSPGQVVQGGRATTYVGATHFMAMLDDVRVSFALFPFVFHDLPGKIPGGL